VRRRSFAVFAAAAFHRNPATGDPEGSSGFSL
jgi:hypothetical protein